MGGCCVGAEVGGGVEGGSVQAYLVRRLGRGIRGGWVGVDEGLSRSGSRGGAGMASLRWCLLAGMSSCACVCDFGRSPDAGM